MVEKWREVGGGRSSMVIDAGEPKRWCGLQMCKGSTMLKCPARGSQTKPQITACDLAREKMEVRIWWWTKESAAAESPQFTSTEQIQSGVAPYKTNPH